MRYPVSVALSICFVAGSSIWSQNTAPSVPVSRLAAAGKLWATIKYFHPSLSESDPGAWDAALLDAIPRVQAATSGEEFAAALTRMLDSLKDSVTRIEKVQPERPLSSFGFASVEDREGVLVVTSGDTGADPLESGERVAKRLP